MKFEDFERVEGLRKKYISLRKMLDTLDNKKCSPRIHVGDDMTYLEEAESLVLIDGLIKKTKNALKRLGVEIDE